MAILGDGGVLVAPPACTPALYGLMSVVEIEDQAEGHWQTGIEYELETCEDIFVMTPKCNGVDVRADVVKDTTGGTVSSDNYSDPFTMVSAYKCSTGGRPIEESWEHAEERLKRNEARTLERTFWVGKDIQNNVIRQSLGNNPDAIDLTPLLGSVNIADGIAALEYWAGENYPCQPVLHTNRGITTYLAERGIAGPDGKVLRNKGTGTPIVAGGGYTKSGPASAAAVAGKSWIYVTGALKVLRSPVFFTPERGNKGAAVDRSINDVVVFAERTYAIQQDCIVAAIQVNEGFGA